MIKWNDLNGQILLDRYEILKEIGEGGAGKVYLAFDKKENRNVAIKTANPHATMSNFLERFEKEAKILSKLEHPNIIKFYDLIEVDDVKMIVMEYVEGISLEDKFRQEKSLPVEEVIEYAEQILSALAVVHENKYFHRDIKTDNMHITVDGKIKLLDFGIVQESDDQDLTRQGSVIGTVSYLAPETIRNPDMPSNPRTEIYSLGIMLYQLLAGVKPFKANPALVGGERNNDLARKIIGTPAIPLNEIDNSISDEVNHFVMKMIEKNPDDRYQTTTEALKDLDAIKKGKTVQSMSGYYHQETKEYSMKKQIIIISVAIVVAVIVLFAILLAAFI